MKNFLLYIPFLLLFMGCKVEVVRHPPSTKVFNATVMEKGTNKPIPNATVSLVRGPGYFFGDLNENNFTKFDTKKTNSSGLATLSSNASEDFGVMSTHPDYIPFFRSEAWGFVEKIYMWPFAVLKVKLKKVNNYAPENKVALRQWAFEYNKLLRPSALDIPELPATTDTIVYMIGLGNDQNQITLTAKSQEGRNYSLIREMKSAPVFVAKGDTVEVVFNY